MMNSNDPNWKTRTYTIGTLVGALLGLVSAYLYSRAAEENVDDTGQGRPARLQTGQMLALSLAALGLIRQVAEMGKPAKK